MKNNCYNININLNDKSKQIYNGVAPNINGDDGFGKIRDNKNNIVIEVFLNDNSSQKSMPKFPKAYNDDYDTDPMDWDRTNYLNCTRKYNNASCVPDNDNKYRYFVETCIDSFHHLGNPLINLKAFVNIKNNKITLHVIQANTNITSIKHALSEAKHVQNLYEATKKEVQVFFKSSEFKNRKSNNKQKKIMIKKMKKEHKAKEAKYQKKIYDLED